MLNISKLYFFVPYNFLSRFSTMMSTVKDVFRKEGFLGFYQGLSALLLREIPANFFYFGGYEGMKQFLRSPEEEGRQLAAWKLVIAGGFGGMTYWASIYPVDVLKTKLQVRIMQCMSKSYFFWDNLYHM